METGDADCGGRCLSVLEACPLGFCTPGSCCELGGTAAQESSLRFVQGKLCHTLNSCCICSFGHVHPGTCEHTPWYTGGGQRTTYGGQFSQGSHSSHQAWLLSWLSHLSSCIFLMISREILSPSVNPLIFPKIVP